MPELEIDDPRPPVVATRFDDEIPGVRVAVRPATVEVWGLPGVNPREFAGGGGSHRRRKAARVEEIGQICAGQLFGGDGPGAMRRGGETLWTVEREEAFHLPVLPLLGGKDRPERGLRE